MRMTLDHEYCLKSDTRVLGVAGETNGREITFHGWEVPGASSYKIVFELPDKTSFEDMMSDGKYTIPGIPVSQSGEVRVQIVAMNGTQMIRKSQPMAMRVIDSINYEPYSGGQSMAGEAILIFDGTAGNIVGYGNDCD